MGFNMPAYWMLIGKVIDPVADRILLNKTDLVSPADLDALEKRLCSINAVAKIHRAKNADVAIAKVLGVGGFNLERAVEVDPQFLEMEYPFEWAGGSGATTTSTSLSFNVNYTLFNNYQRESQVVTTRVNLENAEATLRDAKFLAQQNLTTQLNTYRTAQLSIELNKLQIQAAEENLRVVQQQYNLGTKQLLDLLTAQLQLDNARATLIQARQNARVAKAQIESIIGRDLK